MITLDKVKEHIRLDVDDEDIYIATLINAATLHVTGITGVENDAEAPATYDIVCLLLIAHWYANREAVSIGNMVKIPYGVDALIMNLKSTRDFF